MADPSAELLESFLTHPRIDATDIQVLYTESGVTFAGTLFHAFVKRGHICFVVDWFAEKGGAAKGWTLDQSRFCPTLHLDACLIQEHNGWFEFTGMLGILTVNLRKEPLYHVDPNTGNVLEDQPANRMSPLN